MSLVMHRHESLPQRFCLFVQAGIHVDPGGHVQASATQRIDSHRPIDHRDPFVDSADMQRKARGMHQDLGVVRFTAQRSGVARRRGLEIVVYVQCLPCKHVVDGGILRFDRH